MEKNAIQESINTQHKTVTAMDAQSDFIIGGQEDGTVKVYDQRVASGRKSSAVITYEACHERWISQVRVNPRAE